MKRIFSFVLVLVMLLCSCPPAYGAADTEIGEQINLSATGLFPGPNASHGNHQTRTVHTSHGDYCAYITGSYATDKGTVDTWTLFRIDTETGESTAIFTGEKYFDSSQVSLLVDKDENVWAVTSTSDNGRNISTEGLDLRAHCLDAKTGEIKSYTGIASGGRQDGYGYGTSYYDAKNNRIICMHAGGDYREGSDTGATFNWTYFDINRKRWILGITTVAIDSRHCYMYGFVDENGGLLMMAQRDIKVTSLGYPEVGHSIGLTEENKAYMWDNYIFRQSANYAWDELDLYYIPNIRRAEIYSYSIAEADYSRVTGTQEERNTFEKRLTNFYPTNQNNNGGDFLWVDNEDGKRLLHITYNSSYIQAAMTRGYAIEDIWYHQVWDITDPMNAVKLYNEPITVGGKVADGAKNGGGYNFRLYKDTNGELFLISCFDPSTEKVYYKDGATKFETQFDSKITVYRVTMFDGKYHYVKTGEDIVLPGGGSLINISSHRGGSLVDNRVNILYRNNDGQGDYVFTTVDISYTPSECGDINEDANVNAQDMNLMKRIVSGSLYDFDPALADVDENLTVDAKDANLFKRMIAGA